MTHDYARDYCLLNPADNNQMLRSLNTTTGEARFTSKPYDAMWLTNKKINNIIDIYNKHHHVVLQIGAVRAI
ncbi:hypothetical protein [Ralstonia phage RP13]|nr:hypothetical protein [Ralstonia phage RP13]